MHKINEFTFENDDPDYYAKIVLLKKFKEFMELRRNRTYMTVIHDNLISNNDLEELLEIHNKLIDYKCHEYKIYLEDIVKQYDDVIKKLIANKNHEVEIELPEVKKKFYENLLIEISY